MPQNLQGTSLVAAATDAVRNLFAHLIVVTTQNLTGNDLIRFYIQSPGLNKPISTNLMKVSELSIDKIMAVLTKVLQSKDTIKIDRDFTIDVITIKVDVGAGRGVARKVINISLDRVRKKSILSIPPDERGLCCAKSILYALAHLKNDRRAINALRDNRRSALMTRAIKLHEDACVPEGPCGYAEIQKFEDFLDVQIVVFSSENQNKVSLFFLHLLFCSVLSFFSIY